jgi:transcriptional regulator with XRE-family HTH domain
MKRLCAECGRREVAPLPRSGRTSPYKNFTALPIPSDLEIPTCSHCGAEWIGAMDAERIDAALEKEAAAVLSRLAREAIAAIGETITQGALEERLGLSAGYLSKVKRGREVPSPWLVSALALLAVRPKRLNELANVWTTLALPPRLTSDDLTTWRGDPALTNVRMAV